ncbi:TetR/AcrR family transcriptional regulator [Conexibacter sp. JD483]|uniref:TetR/AcrR family transcriptional regulator n=1 Tax=unclassified Conexibacter TaxID=2627773 RepID=UPI00272050AE|nr:MULTISPECIES: TetR/AcrR family transcriptional regulator [unclassified Conexibacter]MDO8188889.1 TetR/AcrR family transcriptional regulator [Conexibacter sp. CPCC 205706]MDO8201679.1 TetR/AcrR family transcriptional regulator [Conexibacter sp. CPCC 205762]MDR9372141.1 TetR/AcrR family transcriptional regulator [Conexibacter sp. JD483]
MATVDTTPSGETQKTLRADARRNRERVLAAASAAFAAEGFDVGVAEIARRAGVGTGTLFRHFPTKLELEVAVILARKQEMLASVRAALAESDPWAGFVRMMTEGIEMTACDRCIGEVASPELLADERMQALRTELLGGTEQVLARGREAGVIRADLVAEDIFVLSSAIGTTMQRYSHTNPDLWRRYLGVVLDGLRAGGSPAPLQPGPPDQAVLDGMCSSPADLPDLPRSA